MTNAITREQRSRRRDGIEWACKNGIGYRLLAYHWGMSVAGAWFWCQRNATEAECATIARNGLKIGRRKRLDTIDQRRAA